MFLRKNENGRSMIEMLGVLGIMAVITVLSIAAYTMAMKNIKVNNAKGEISTIVQQIKSICSGQDYKSCLSVSTSAHVDRGGKYNALFVATGLMDEGNAFGNDNGVSDGSFSEGYGVSYGTLSSIQTYTGDPSIFTITFYSSDMKSCKLLLAQNWGDDIVGTWDGGYSDRSWCAFTFN